MRRMHLPFVILLHFLRSLNFIFITLLFNQKIFFYHFSFILIKSECLCARFRVAPLCSATAQQYIWRSYRKTTSAKIYILCVYESRVSEKPDDKTMAKRERNIFNIELPLPWRLSFSRWLFVVFLVFSFKFRWIECDGYRHTIYIV